MRRAALESRRDLMRQLRARTQALGAWEHECETKVDAARERLKEARSTVSCARSRVLQALEAIYPIELVDARELVYSIAGIPLKNGVVANAPSAEYEQAAAALGLAAQLVVLLSTYLSTPLPYPIVAVGSRAVIKDAISNMQGPRACVAADQLYSIWRARNRALSVRIRRIPPMQGYRAADERTRCPNC